MLRDRFEVYCDIKVRCAWRAVAIGRVLELLSGHPDYVSSDPSANMRERGPRCSVVFNAGHVLSAGDLMLRLPRGTLEMFIDHDTVAYRQSGLSGMPERGGNNVDHAPAMQFHRLRPRGTDREEEETTQPVPGEFEPCGWDGDSYYCEERGDDGEEPGPTIVTETASTTVNYLVRAYGIGPYRRSADLVLPNNIRRHATGPVVIDAADLASSYLIDYDMYVLDALRLTEGDLSFRVYFPGYIKNEQVPSNPEHPHYVSWTLDMGMMEGEMNEVFAKLTQCAIDHEIDGSKARSGS